MSTIALHLPGFRSTDFSAASDAGVIRLTLSKHGHAALDVGRDRVAIDVRRGSVWVTQDDGDHVLADGERFRCATRRRVVVTALEDALIDVRREPAG